MSDLFDPRWELAEISVADFGPYRPPLPEDEEKVALWEAFHAGNPTRVPVLYGVNNRVALMDARIGCGDLTFEQAFLHPEYMLKAQLLFDYVYRMRYNRFCDSPMQLPDVWRIPIHFQNVYEAWYFGCPVNFAPGQIPDSTPIYTGDNQEAVFDIDISRPLERPPFKTAVDFYYYLQGYIADKTFLDRPIEILSPGFGTDGPLTVAMNIRGNEILTDMITAPENAHRMFRFIVEAALIRRKAFLEYFEMPDGGEAGLADDSIAMLGIDQYREHIMPHHRYYYESINPDGGRRSMHLCGDATRFFPVLHEELGVATFDTGFPVDFGRLRHELGPDVAIMGGVEVATLVNGTPDQVYARSKDILSSGIMEGGRFVFREGNNLPPNVPWSNLAAMYQATHEFGQYL